jgi:hypothetical protein
MPTTYKLGHGIINLTISIGAHFVAKFYHILLNVLVTK